VPCGAKLCDDVAEPLIDMDDATGQSRRTRAIRWRHQTSTTLSTAS
jgi:hypothetical protein